MRFNAAVLTASITAGLTMTVAPAGAAPTTPKAQAAWDCPAGSVCLYDEAGGVGRFSTASDGCWFDDISRAEATGQRPSTTAPATA